MTYQCVFMFMLTYIKLFHLKVVSRISQIYSMCTYSTLPDLNLFDLFVKRDFNFIVEGNQELLDNSFVAY
jgi:hypothetical protein